MSEVKSPFRGLSKKIKVVTVAGQKIKVKPKVKHAEMFTTLKEQRTSEDAKMVTQILFEIVKEANPDEEDEDIYAHIRDHYGEWMKTMAVLYGFATEEEFEKMRKKLTGQ
jgi:hypothetical protein